MSGGEGDVAFLEVLLRVEQGVEFKLLSQILFVELGFNSVKLVAVFINNKTVSGGNGGFDISISASY